MTASSAAAGAPFARIRLCPAPVLDGFEQWSGGHPLSAFASWKWDGATLTVSTDRFGLYPLFYTADSNGIAISPSLAQLASFLPDRERDWDALGIFLRLGYFLGEDTPFRGIRVANGPLEWRNGALSAAPRSPEPVKPLSIARDEAVRTYGRLFADSVRKRTPQGKVLAPLSGGRDSRHIFLELLRAGFHVDAAVTMDSPYSDERGVAAKLCERTGVRHVVADVAPYTLETARVRNAETCFCSDEHLWAGKLRNTLRTEGAGVIYDGIAGDVLSQSKNLSPDRLRLMREGGFREFARQLVEAEDRFLRGVLAPDLLARMPLERVLERMEYELSRHRDQPNPVGSFFLWNRMRREIALVPFHLMSEFTVHAPFLDDELYEFLHSLPAEFLMEEKFHDAVIAAEFPQYADVPYAGRKSLAEMDALPPGEAFRMLCYLAGNSDIRKAQVLTRLTAMIGSARHRKGLQALVNWPVYLRQLGEL